MTSVTPANPMLGRIENFNFVIFLDTINVIIVKTLFDGTTEKLFSPVSVTDCITMCTV